MTTQRKHRWATNVVAAVLASGSLAVLAESAPRDLPPAGKVRDLDYGDVLFHFFQDDYFESLVRLEVSRDLQRIDHHAAEAELLSGGLYLSLGLHLEASRIFNRLLAGPVPQSVSDRALFYLASQFQALRASIGLVFYVWIGVFNMMVVAQLWSFANDLYDAERGKRLFPLVALGASLGAALGSKVAAWLVEPLGVYALLLVSGGLLVL